LSRVNVEFRELCRYAQKYKGDFMFYDKYLLLCHQKGVSPSKAAEDAGFAKSLVTKWKTKKIDIPSADVLSKLSAYFCVPISELLDEEKEQPTVNLDGLSKNRKALVEYALSLTEEQAGRAYRLLKAIVEGDL
jgi:transcriptional regulator with XRE-family HTH domain